MNTESKSVDRRPAPERQGDADSHSATQTERKETGDPDGSLYARSEREGRARGEMNGSEPTDDKFPRMRIRITADELALCNELAAMPLNEFVAFVTKFRPSFADLNPLVQGLVHLLMSFPTTPPFATPFNAAEREGMMRAIKAARQ
jgi:hypothetical protein